MNILFPSVYLDSVYAIDYEKVKELGYKAIIFDIDSTLVPHGDDTSDQVDELFAHIHDVGLKTLLLSNNSDEQLRFLTEIFKLCISLWRINLTNLIF